MKTILPALLAAAALAAAALPAFAQDPAPAAGAPAATNAVAAAAPADPFGAGTSETPALDGWVEHIRQGGKTMVFLGLLSVLGLGCALERFVNLRRGRIAPKNLAEDVCERWGAGDIDGVVTLCARNRSALARVVETMLEHRDSKDFAEVKTFAEDKAGRELRLETRKAGMLATVATLAPLLGLFGTVLGLLEAFGTVAAMGEMGDASVLADSIGKALVTTVAGLAIAMPALFCHQVLKNRLALYSVYLEEEIAEIVRRVFVAKR